ncbi:MAG: Uma2 family endonuclease [Blastocatellia bacterium]
MAQPLAQSLTAQPLFTEEDYLMLERQADERSEYMDGVVYAMAGESQNHGRISANLVAIVVTHLRGKKCEAFTRDTKVRSGPLPGNKRNTKGLFSYPDLVVVCGELQYLDEHRDVLVNPSMIIEVLSDSTENRDRKQKFLRSQKYLPALTVYVLVSQELPLIEVFHRDAPDTDSWHYFRTADLAGTIRLPVIDCELKLAEVYDRVTFPPSDDDEEGDFETDESPAQA